MISSLDGEPFEPAIRSDLDFVLSLEDLPLFPVIDDTCDIVVNVLKSSHSAEQSKYFVSAFDLISQHVPNIFKRMSIHYIINKDIRDRDWSPNDVVNWLLSSHIHVIYSHVHQGYYCYLIFFSHFQTLSLKLNLMLGIVDKGYSGFNPWNVRAVEGELSRLCYHIGFPGEDNLKCPIFLQNKCAYSFAIPDLSLPCLVVPFDADIEDISVRNTISEYVVVFCCHYLYY